MIGDSYLWMFGSGFGKSEIGGGRLCIQADEERHVKLSRSGTFANAKGFRVASRSGIMTGQVGTNDFGATVLSFFVIKDMEKEAA